MGDKNKGKLIQILKPRPFRYGENFKQFCKRFKQYVAISEIKENLDKIFLSLVDDRTFAKLTSEEFEAGSDKDLKKLCESALKMYYPSSNELNLISNLMNIRQEKLESIDDFEYKLSLAAARIEGAEKFKITAFINGLKNSAIKLEIRKNCETENLSDYSEIVNLAKIMESFQAEGKSNSNFDICHTDTVNFRREEEGATSASNFRAGCENCGLKNHDTSRCRLLGHGCTFCNKTNHVVQNCYRLNNKKIRKELGKLLAEFPESEDSNSSDPENLN